MHEHDDFVKAFWSGIFALACLFGALYWFHNNVGNVFVTAGVIIGSFFAFKLGQRHYRGPYLSSLLYRQIRKRYDDAGFPDEAQYIDKLLDTYFNVANERGLSAPPPGVLRALARMAQQVFKEAALGELPLPPTHYASYIEQARYRDRLRDMLPRAEKARLASALLWQQVLEVFLYVTELVPEHARVPWSDFELDAPANTSLTLPLFELVPEIGEVIERVMALFMQADAAELGLFSTRIMQYYANMRQASQRRLSQQQIDHGQLVAPHAYDGSPEDIVRVYLNDTPLEAVFLSPVPFVLPDRLRFEHTHIVAGSGHGKTQALQHLILSDLRRPDPPGLVIIDSQGDMLEKIERHIRNSPLANRLVVIDPRNAPQLNIFDINQDRLAQYGPAIREQVLNGAIELYDYLFAFLGADLTTKQSVFFRYSLRLLLTLPQALGRNATILDLLQLMHDPTPYLPAITLLPPIQKQFFETDFQNKMFSQTKEQIRYRLNGLLENDTFARMLSAPVNDIDLFDALNGGSIILVNTAKDYLKSERSSFLGRLFIALTMNGTFERAAIPESRRHPAFLYIDEAAEYFDDRIDDLLIQARKYRLGVTFSHQFLDQLTPSLRSSVAANTGIKLAGGVSDRDARALAPDMRTSPEFIMRQHRGERGTRFACSLRSSRSAVSLSIPFGMLEREISQLPALPPPERHLPAPASPADEPPPNSRMDDLFMQELEMQLAPQQKSPSSPPPQQNVHLRAPDLPWRLERPEGSRRRPTAAGRTQPSGPPPTDGGKSAQPKKHPPPADDDWES